MTSDLELALRLADAADAISLPLFGAGLAVERKADLTPVTEADRSVEAELRRQLAEARPDDGILGEEEGVTGGGRLGRTCSWPRARPRALTTPSA